MLAGIATGIFVSFLIGSILGEFVLHKAEAGIFPGLVAGIWAALPFLYRGKVQRYNFLHPVPRRYQVPLRHAFSKVRTMISDKTYNYGDRWRILTADTQTRRIHAALQFIEEEEKRELGKLDTYKQSVRRYLEMHVQFSEEPHDTTVIQFDFHPKVEGLSYHACDEIVAALIADVQAALGTSTKAGNPIAIILPAPPWWLLGVTGLALFLICTDVMAEVFKR